MTSPAPAPAPPPVCHVVPSFEGEREHEPAVTCWCEPELSYRDPDTDGEVWVHHRVQ